MSEPKPILQWMRDVADALVCEYLISTGNEDAAAQCIARHAPDLDAARTAGWQDAVAHHAKDFAEFSAKHDVVLARLLEDYDTAIKTIDQLAAHRDGKEG